nr:hypothetical protein [uncultured Sphingomonas sp.]
MHKLGIAALLALGAAACGTNHDESNIAVGDAVDVGENANMDAEVLPPSEAGGNTSLPANESTVEPPSADPNQPLIEGNEKAVIPTSMQGRWGMNTNDCDPSRSDAKGLIRISADTLRFYESVAKIERVTLNAPENFTADFAFMGEGMEWKKSENLKLTNSSKTLIRTDKDGSWRYQRCS